MNLSRRALARFVIPIAIFIIGFAAGRLFQHARSGYRIQVLKQTEHRFAIGPVRQSFVTESVGMPFLDPGTSILQWNNRIIYKAQRAFQESVPVADHILTSGNTIHWDDGEFHFRLTIDKMTNPPPAVSN